MPTAHVREVLRFVNGPVVFWDLSRVPEDYRERGGQLPLPIAKAIAWKCERVLVKFGYPLPKGANP
ncbi:unnamed protein product [Staurois parvus]|uniref:Uncharacterized protein n=1 Tax=Staurois parvus TaxID=386267 RepID=A0ABN9HRR2_9NEOB|nr:unnamed protein product [Staurois parvus]